MTLEKGKSYGQEQIQQTLQDKSRTRLNNPAPHQAPQRERVSRATIPSGRAGSQPRTRSRRWKSLIRPDVNLGVPQLMMILEPNIVWEHTKAFVPGVGKDVEANVTPGEFFDGWHKGGRRAHGVYEGSYWELMGDCEELAEMLRKLSKAPALLEEPPLELPPPPELPAWDDFKPNLHLIPAAPSMPVLKLPPFRAPILEPEPPFVEPEYLPVPPVPSVPKEEPLPIFIPPEFLQVEPLVEPEYVDPPPPLMPDVPPPPSYGQPKHGHDWSGLRPFQLDLPSRDAFLARAAAQRVMDTSRFVHPPNSLPVVPELEPLDEDLLKGLDLEPIPRLELAWMGGPEPDPPFSSVPSSPAALSRSTSRAPSRPVSAAPSRPISAAQSRPMSGAPSRPMSAAVQSGSPFEAAGNNAAAAASTATVPARTRVSSAASQRKLTGDGAARPWSGGPRAGSSNGDGEAAATMPEPSPRIRSARRGSSISRTSLAVVKTPEDQAWEEARSVASEASGTPRLWVNFSAPFADLPPIMMPPRPEPGPEPLPEEFPHEQLEDLPVLVAPPLLESPVYVEPPQFVPQWASPCEPRPVGFLRGSAPLLICDVSGTMHPRQQGRFRDLKRCAVDLLDPEGEIATAAAGFDVITFAGGAWSWSAGYGERMGLLQSSQVPYSGRQVGGKYSSKAPPGAGGAGAGSRTSSPDRFRAGASAASSASGGLALMPTQPDLLSDAQRWVANWPDAVGQTNMIAAFTLAEQHAGADCWYILSDGMAHDQQACLEFLARRNEAGNLPVIHAVGFIPAEANPDSAGERFLRGLAELTGGSYQRYTPDIHKVWVTGQGFQRVDLRNETPEQREERQWAEKQLRAERIKNLRLGISEPLEVTMERVAVLHQQLRVAPAVRANDAALAEARRRHAVAMESVRLTNERRVAEATAAYDAAAGAVRARNQAKVDAAREAFLQAHGDWERDYMERLQDWEDAKAALQSQREEQLSAARGGGDGGGGATAKPSPRTSSGRPYVSIGGGSTGSRPTSAAAYAALPKNKAGSGLLPLNFEPSEHRAAYAVAEYDTVMGLDRVADKLSSPAHTPPGSRPVSAIASTTHSGGGGASRPVSALKAAAAGGGSGSGGGGSRPVSGNAADAAAGLETTAGGASEYLEAITEDMAEASAPLDAVYGGGEDDGLDVRPSKSRSGGGGRGGRDQDGAGRRSTTTQATSSRPVSGRMASAGSSSRVTSARSASSAAPGSRKPTGQGMLQEGSTLPPPPLLPEPTAPLQPLRGEKSDEFKRRLLPPEVVEEHDATNTTRLDDIRQLWESLVATDLEVNNGRKLAAMRRNAGRVEEYRKAVYEAYANGLIRDVVYGGAVRVAANMALMDSAEARYLAEVERVNAENARLRQLHASELEEKKAKEAAHANAIRRWEETKETLARQHQADREKARAEHEANIIRLKAEWRAKTQQVLELNDARLTEAEAMHEALVEQVKENNRRHKDDHTELLRQRKEVEATNLSRLAEAKAVHKVRLEARTAENERLIKTAMEEHQATCVRLQEEYDESKVQAEVDHAELCAFLKAANEQLTEEARRRYQEALAGVQAAYEADCAAVREAHTRDLERVKRFNQEIWPKVHVARLAQAELGRVQVFAEHIRHCANKFELGINLMPNTPNFDRVVEMQALTEGLAKAFPDMPPQLLPWPEHERRLEPGTGWVASPPTRTLTYRDPMDIINRIAKGKTPLSANSPASGSSRNESPAAQRAQTSSAEAEAGVLSAVGSVDDLPHPHQPLQHAYLSQLQQQQHHMQPNSAGSPYTPRHISRPLSAGRARFANVLNADMQRPLSAAVPAPCSARVEAWGIAAAAAASALSSPGGALRPQSACYQNPSAWRRSNTTVLRTGSPRGMEPRRNSSNLGPGAGGVGGPPSTAGGTSTSQSAAVAAAAAATAAMGGLTSRPGTARPGTAHSGGVGSAGATRPRSAGPAPRPPARVAVDITSLQASVARAKAQAGAHALTAATLAGFSKDVPKLRYPEVDVPQALTIASSLKSG